MLQKASKSSVAQASKPDLKIGDFLIYRKHGMCVLRGHRDMEISGINMRGYDIRQIVDLQTSITVPEARWTSDYILPPPSLEEVKEAVDILTAKPKQLSGLWKRREETLNNLLDTGEITNIASVVHLIYSKNRGKKLPDKKKQVIEPLDDIEISYSERRILMYAADSLTNMLAYRCGLTQKEAKNFIYRAVLSPSFVEGIELADTTNGKTGYSSREFERAFGETLKEAGQSKGDTSLDITLPEAPERRSDISYADAGMSFTPRVSPEKTVRAMPVRSGGRTGRQLANDNRLSDARKTSVLPQNENTYAQLIRILPKSGGSAKIMLGLAARSLRSPEDVKIATKLWFASMQNRLSHAEMHEELQLDEEAYKSRLQTIIKQLKDAANVEGLAAIDSYKFPTSDKTSRVRAPQISRIPEQNRDAYETLKTQLSSVAHAKSVLKLAAETFTDSVDLILTGKLWLVARDNRRTHAEMREKLELDDQAYEEKIQSVVERLEKAGAEKNLAAVKRVSFHMRDSQKGERQSKRAIPEHNQEVHTELEPELSKTPHFRSVFNLAARTLSSAEDFKIAAKLWLVGRGYRVSHADMREELALSEEDYRQRLENISDTLKTKAEEKGLKAIDKITFSFDDKAGGRSAKISRDIKPQSISVEQKEGNRIISLSVSEEDIAKIGGLNLTIEFDEQSGAAIITGKAMNKKGERKRFDPFEIQAEVK